MPTVSVKDMSTEAVEELEDYGVNTYFEGEMVQIDWADQSDAPLFKKWLTNTYGTQIKNYKKIFVFATIT